MRVSKAISDEPPHATKNRLSSGFIRQIVFLKLFTQSKVSVVVSKYNYFQARFLLGIGKMRKTLRIILAHIKNNRYLCALLRVRKPISYA